MPKAGKFDAVLQQLQNKLPQKGFFSVLDEMVNAAPFEKAPAKEWSGYLQPGKLLEREGVKFPLKKEELQYAELSRALEELSDAGPTIEKARLMERLRGQRPGFRETIQGIPWGDKAGLSRLSERYGDRASFKEEGSFPEYAHQGVPYVESITSSPEFGHFPTHFGNGVISHSRRTTHELPDLDQRRTLNLIEEIQSDRHQAAATRVWRHPTAGTSDMYGSPLLGWEEVGRRGYRTGEEEIELSGLEDLTSRTPIEDNRLSEVKRKPPDAPFKDPKEYGELEMKKQLLDAVNSDANYLGLVRGSDQIERYPGLEEAGEKGMGYMYDEIYPSVLRKLAHRYGADVKEVKTSVIGGGDEPEILQELGMDFPSFLDGTRHEFFSGEGSLHGVTPADDFLHEMERDLPFEKSGVQQAREALEGLKSTPGTDGDKLQDFWDEFEDHIHDLYGTWRKEFGGSMKSEKSFPAIELTPEIKALIKKVGVPLWALAGAGIIPPDQETPQYAEGGKVSKTIPERLSELTDDTGIKHFLAGLQSQVYSQPHPDENWKDPGYWQPGLVNDLLALFGNDDANERVERASKKTRKAMKIGEPHGFIENLADASGIMTGQLPIPSSMLSKGPKLAQETTKVATSAMDKLKQAARFLRDSGPEFFFPTIDPKLSNYLSGSGFGGVLGWLGEEEPDLDDLSKRYNVDPPSDVPLLKR